MNSKNKHKKIESVVLLHACAHNPTGMDPQEDEWRRILQSIKVKEKKKHKKKKKNTFVFIFVLIHVCLFFL